MRKIILVVGLLLEILVLVAIYDTHRKMSGKVPFIIDNVQEYSSGTYVMAREGPVRLYWYWVYQYWYLTVLCPIGLSLILWWVSFRRRGSSTAT